MQPCFPCFRPAHPSPVATLRPATDSTPLPARVHRRIPPKPPPLPGDDATSIPLRRSPAPLLYRRCSATPSPLPPLLPGRSITTARLPTATLAVPPLGSQPQPSVAAAPRCNGYRNSVPLLPQPLVDRNRTSTSHAASSTPLPLQRHRRPADPSPLRGTVQ
ncbi:uncharacterized protein LOC135629232 [Musa acuminata AAA Group]|uniref:uncharacterized protein LOC135629232 n=1 Tax=Musa acuminata AAA Group TaxID=214697 RepID=UPI0031DE6C5E